MTIYFKPITVVLAVATFLGLHTTVYSQDTGEPIDTTRVYELQEVIISASRYEQQPSSVGRNVTVITREEIENSAYGGLGELLSHQQSLHIIGDSQTPGSLTQGFLRNSNSNHFIVMIDGVRISDPSTVNNGIDLSELSLLGVERIEIVRGSHSTLYGSSAIGGVINIITQNDGEETFNADVSSQHGTFGSGTYSTTNSIMTGLNLGEGFYVNAGLLQKYSSGLDATIDTVTGPGSFNPQDRDAFDKLDLTAKAGYESSSVDAYVSYRREDQSSDVDQGAFNDDSNARTDFERGLLGYGMGIHPLDNLEVRFEGAYTGLERVFVNDSSLVDAQGNYDGTYVETNAEGTLWENDLTVSWDARHLTMLVGAEATIQTMNFRNYVFSRSPFGVFEQTTDLDSLDLKEEVYSGFVHANISGSAISPSLDPFSLVLGTRLVDHNAFGTHLTYEVNPKLKVGSALLYGALSTGFNSPSLYQLNSPEQGAFETYSIGNRGLDPETSVSYELGWKQEIGEEVHIDLSLFRTEVSNVIEYAYLWSGDTPIENLGFMDYLGDTYINISKQEINGLELGLEVKPNKRFSFGGNMKLTKSTLGFSPEDLDESYTADNHVQIFESGEFVDREKELEGLSRRPKVSALLQATYRPVEKLSVGITSKFVGSRDDIFYSANLGPFGALDKSKIEGYNLTDINLHYQATPRLSLAAKAGNIFDTDYVELKGYRTKGRGLYFKARYRLGSL